MRGDRAPGVGGDLMAARFLDDLSIGDRFVSDSVIINREEMIAFAAKYDPQGMHLDDEAARASIFGELIASGWFTLALTIRMMVEAKPFGETPLIGMEVDEVRFPRPVKPGMRLRAEGEIIDLRASRTRPGRGYVRMRIRTIDEKAGEVLIQQWRLLVPRKKS